MLAGHVLTSPHGLVRPVQVAVVRGGIIVAKGFAEGNLRAHVRRQASNARRNKTIKHDVRPVVGGSLGGVVDRIERMNRSGDRYKDRSWKHCARRSTQYRTISHEIVLDS
jgi:hypothetical protein